MNPLNTQKLKDYYAEVSTGLCPPHVHEKVAYIVVTHVLPDAPEFVEAVSKLGRIAAVVPKTSHRDPRTFKALAHLYNVPFEETFAPDDKPKDRLRDPKRAIDFILEHTNIDEKIIILDHGGYFAPAYRAMLQDPRLRNRIGDPAVSRILGITEATENGHQKYEKAIERMEDDRAPGLQGGLDYIARPLIPIYSRARSELKAAEDHNVGAAIVHSTEGILRNLDGARIEECETIGVFGFGKIGRAVAQKLQREGRQVIVCEKDPKIAALAHSMGFRVATKEWLLANADLLFCATGSRVLRGDDWQKLKDGVYIASATSADDEFDKEALIADCATPVREADNTAYALHNGKTVNLLMDGDAVNFVDKSVLGPSVFLPEGETLATANFLRNARLPETRISADNPPIGFSIKQLPSNMKDWVASYWLKHFAKLDKTRELPPLKA
jgi:adenosylhomocysteinase